MFLHLYKSSNNIFELIDDFLLAIDFLEELEVDLFGHFETLFDLTVIEHFGFIIGTTKKDFGGLITLFLKLFDELVLIFNIGAVLFE